MDHASELSKGLGRLQKNTAKVLTRKFSNNHVIERGRDVLNAGNGFTLYFATFPDTKAATLDLTFASISPSQGCTGSYCAACEIFTGIDEVTLQLSHNYVNNTMRVFLNEVRTLSWSASSPDEIILSSLPELTDIIKVCYLWRVV